MQNSLWPNLPLQFLLASRNFATNLKISPPQLRIKKILKQKLSERNEWPWPIIALLTWSESCQFTTYACHQLYDNRWGLNLGDFSFLCFWCNVGLWVGTYPFYFRLASKCVVFQHALDKYLKMKLKIQWGSNLTKNSNSKRVNNEYMSWWKRKEIWRVNKIFQ